MTGALTFGDRAAVDRLLGVPEMAWLVARVRPRILAAGDEPLRGVVRLDDPTDRQRAAVVRLVGRPRRGGSSLRVDLGTVEQVLRRGPWPAGLADAVETLTGPVVDRAAERAHEDAAWDAARRILAPVTDRFGLAEWWGAWCAAGGLKRVAGAEVARISSGPGVVAAEVTGPVAAHTVAGGLVERVVAVLGALPAAGQPLAVLARETVGDAHGLDQSRPLGRLAVAVVRAAFLADVPDGERSVREVWASAGVVLSNVASTVLCLGVPGAAGGDGLLPGLGGRSHPQLAADRAAGRAREATSVALEAMRLARAPVVLTLDQVRSGAVRTLPRTGVVHVCENPTVVEVAATRWASARPGSPAGAPARTVAESAPVPVLVCTWGQPSTAVIELLRTLAADGAEVRYHGDFDWSGLRIAGSLGAHVSWIPWRFGAGDYRAVVRREGPVLRLSGRPAPSPWDPELAAVMAEHGWAVEEEAVADLLAADVFGKQ